MISFTPHQSFYLFCVYLVAAIPFGVVISLLVRGKDVRDQGSGNIGATNVSRMMGKKWGILVLLLDALKGYLAVYFSVRFGGNRFENLAGLMAIFAHCYPMYLGFKGGKGVATALGVVAALSLTSVAILAGVFAAVFLLSRRISAGSIAAAASLPLVAFLYTSHLRLFTATLIGLLVLWKHRENALRLWRNEEPAFF